MNKNELLDTCSFCNKHKDTVTKLIVGENVAICNECVDLCQNLLNNDVDEKATSIKPQSVDPVAINEHLDEYVIPVTGEFFEKYFRGIYNKENKEK
jgi:ATP-dependent protease Clp ATPase subunit